MKAVVFLAALGVSASAAGADPARVAIVIDDLGHRATDAERIAGLPGPVACAVLPDTPYAAEVARACHEAGKTVLLHLPMESADPSMDPGAGALWRDQDRAEIRRRIALALEQVPHAVGVNNHMGSALTSRIAPMHWVMTDLAGRRLWFLDSVTTPATVAADAARMAGVPALKRDIFLDDERDAAAVAAQWQRLLSQARRAGRAIAIGHPHPETLEMLRAAIPRLAREGFSLVSPADMMSEISAGEPAWPAYSSP